MEKKKRGFALMTPEARRVYAQMGGMTVSQNREHMAELGHKGGLKISQDKAHMSAIGRTGAINGWKKRKGAVLPNV
jgi:uncharacterized protein